MLGTECFNASSLLLDPNASYNTDTDGLFFSVFGLAIFRLTLIFKLLGGCDRIGVKFYGKLLPS